VSTLQGHEALFETIDQSPLAMVISNPRRPDNPLEVVNAAFLAITGYAEADVVGRNCRFLARGGDEPATATLRDAIAIRRPVLTEIVNYRADGSAFRNGVMITPLFDEDGGLAWFLGSQVDLGPVEEGGLRARQSRAAGLVAGLSPRQHEILAMVSKGFLNKQIAYELGISEKTVKMHRALMLERLGVATSAEAIRIAVEAGL
jgi:PAS domain S-box-containing protein